MRSPADPPNAPLALWCSYERERMELGADEVDQRLNTSHLIKKRKQPLQFGVVGLAAVFANFEGFGVLDRVRGVTRIPFGEFLVEPRSNGLVAAGKTFAHLTFPLLLPGRIIGIEPGGSVRSPFRKLRNHHAESIELLFNHRID